LKFRFLRVGFLPALPPKALLPSSGLESVGLFFFVFFPVVRRRSGADDEPPSDPTQMPVLQKVLHSRSQDRRSSALLFAAGLPPRQ
jgi:hypothetical protein